MMSNKEDQPNLSSRLNRVKVRISCKNNISPPGGITRSKPSKEPFWIIEIDPFFLHTDHRQSWIPRQLAKKQKRAASTSHHQDFNFGPYLPALAAIRRGTDGRRTVNYWPLLKAAHGPGEETEECGAYTLVPLAGLSIHSPAFLPSFEHG
jgi:hypothetical protein